ncbi:methyltransferase domain-containing protein [Aliarcobacter cryaerophilus]|uniref:Class I SAM-dependent methyltransferase n=1 Tax=Aliarcobacter cryaerophilus TaxID=28198 RepID=A0A2S9SNK8_9BACT|nr:methyltransferase domain-containing protein [Aliarcobacter cryaerophilus]PRM88152.1 hypothetical protein CJ669_05215 [Aliarcobacter cryaerophilus]
MIDDNNIEIVPCPWCGSRKNTKWCEDEVPFVTVQCNDCKVVYVKNRLNENGRIEYYKNYNTEKHQAQEKSILRDDMYKIENSLVAGFLKGGDILDVGCGGAFFLDSFDSEKYNKHGVEYGDDGFKVASLKYPNKISQGEFPLLDNIEDNSMDLVIFRGVLEHVVNPKDYLQKANRVLRDGGYIFITATPNLNSLCADLFRDKFNQHIPAEHIIHFSDEHFKDYLKELGFNLVSERVYYLETPYANIYEDAKKITKAIQLKEKGEKIDFKSPAWYGNMMTLLFKKED